MKKAVAGPSMEVIALKQENARDMEIDLDAGKVIAIAGVRGAGKTHVMFQCIDRLYI